MANEYNFIPTSVNDYWNTFYNTNIAIEVGKESGTSTSGALRYTNVNIARNTTLIDATLSCYIGVLGPSTSTSLKYHVWGIAEDNTGAFSSSPMGRSKTSANDARNTNLAGLSAGNRFGIGVTSEMQEIINRSGWNSGQALGFIIEDNGTADGIWFYDAYTSPDTTNTYLSVLTTARPNFTPSPTQVTAPSDPISNQNFGLIMSKTGKSVFSTNDYDINFITSRPILKAQFYGLQNVSAGVLANVPHTLGYKGAFLVYAKGNSYRFKLPRFLDGAADPVGGGVQGYASIDNSNLGIYSSKDGDAYYYVFIDDISI